MNLEKLFTRLIAKTSCLPKQTPNNPNKGKYKKLSISGNNNGKCFQEKNF